MSTETFISSKHIKNPLKSEGWGGLTFLRNISGDAIGFVSQGDGGSVI